MFSLVYSPSIPQSYSNNGCFDPSPHADWTTPANKKDYLGLQFHQLDIYIYMWLFQMMDYPMMVSGSMFPQSRTEKAIVIPAWHPPWTYDNFSSELNLHLRGMSWLAMFDCWSVISPMVLYCREPWPACDVPWSLQESRPVRRRSLWFSKQLGKRKTRDTLNAHRTKPWLTVVVAPTFR